MEHGNSPTDNSGLMSKVKDGAISQLNTQKNRATDGIGSVAKAVREGSKNLRNEQHDTIAHYVDQAASQLDRFANAMRNRDVDDMFDDVQRFARRNAATFIGSAFAAGLLTARFFKSSRRNGHTTASWRERTSPGIGSGIGSTRVVPSAVGTAGAPLSGTDMRPGTTSAAETSTGSIASTAGTGAPGGRGTTTRRRTTGNT